MLNPANDAFISFFLTFQFPRKSGLGSSCVLVLLFLGWFLPVVRSQGKVVIAANVALFRAVCLLQRSVLLTFPIKHHFYHLIGGSDVFLPPVLLNWGFLLNATIRRFQAMNFQDLLSSL